MSRIVVVLLRALQIVAAVVNLVLIGLGEWSLGFIPALWDGRGKAETGS